jgi:NAD-binding of NADP-dependent 3-hydroxyisobutyrate dehydrogenase
MLSEGIGIDTGVSGRCDGPLRSCVVGLQPVVETSMVSEGEQRLLRDGVDRVRGSQPAIEAVTLAEAVEGGPLDAPIADAKLHQMVRGDFAPEFPLEWALKDVDLAIGAAGGGTLPLLAAPSGQWHAAVDAGHGREDVSAARLALSGSH